MSEVKIIFTEHAKEVMARVKVFPETMMGAIAAGMDEENVRTVSLIQRDYMSFPKSGETVFPGLRVITGRLRASVNSATAAVRSGTVNSSIGSNVVYAAIHEFGGVIVHPARAGKVRLRTDAQGTLLRQAGNTHLTVFAKKGHKRVKEVEFEGKRYEVHMPARHPILRGIEDAMPNYGKTISKRVVQTIIPKA